MSHHSYDTEKGIIAAGLFDEDLMLLKQLGFAVAVGVLIDAFVVRTILDPALATAFGRWTWWPGGLPQPHVTHAGEVNAPPDVLPQGVQPRAES